MKFSPVHSEIKLLNRQQKLHDISRFFLGQDCHALPLFETQQGMLLLFLLRGLKLKGLGTPRNLGNEIFEMCCHILSLRKNSFTDKYATTTTKVRSTELQADEQTDEQTITTSDSQSVSQTDRQTDMQTDGVNDGQTSRKTDKKDQERQWNRAAKLYRITAASSRSYS